MFDERVHETCTTSGTGNITLAGAATGMVTFNAAFGTDRCFAYVIDDESGNWETGIGYLSAPTTLVRDYVLRSSNSDALVSFGGGTKQVINAPLGAKGRNNIVASMDQLSTQLRAIWSNCQLTTNASAVGAADRIYYSIFELEVGGFFEGIAALITSTTASAGEEALIGLYELDPNTMLPGNLVTENDAAIAVDASGLITHSFASNIYIPAGWYYSALVCEVTTANFKAHPAFGSRTSFSPMGTTSAGRTKSICYETYSSGWTTPVLPASAAAAGSLTIESEFATQPQVGLVPVLV